MSAKSTKHDSKTSKSRTNWAKLHQKDDSDINYSDSAATDKSFWEDAEVFMPVHKIHLSLRLDEDIIAFFKKQGRGYQTKINAVLKAYVKRHEHARTAHR